MTDHDNLRSVLSDRTACEVRGDTAAVLAVAHMSFIAGTPGAPPIPGCG